MTHGNLEKRSSVIQSEIEKSGLQDENFILALSKACAKADAQARAYAREVKLGEYLAHLKTADIRYRACA